MVQAAPIYSLTGIRGVAALWVIIFHTMDHIGMIHGHEAFGALPITRDGFRGVDLFFVLSGFIMMHVHHADFETLSRERTTKFFILRVFRTYPLNAAALLLILAFVLAAPGFVEWYRQTGPEHLTSYDFAGFWQTLFLANRWLMPDLGEWNGPTWSLSVEFLAYFSFPVLALLLNRERSRWRCLAYAAGFIGFLAASQVAMHHGDENLIGRVAILRALTCFPAGAALCRFVALARAHDPDPRWPAWAAAGSCVVLLALLLIPHAAVLAPFCFGGLIVGLSYQRGAIDRVLRGRVCMFLGKISFAIYLIHVVPLLGVFWLIDIHVIPDTPAALIATFAAYAAVLILASLPFHYLVERPAQRVGRRLVARLSTAPRDAPRLGLARPRTEA